MREILLISAFLALAGFDYAIRHNADLGATHEICSEAKTRGYKLVSCGYYRWQVEP